MFLIGLMGVDPGYTHPALDRGGCPKGCSFFPADSHDSVVAQRNQEL